MKRRLVASALALVLLCSSTALLAQTRVKKVVFQAFWWDYWNSNFPNGWANYLTELAPRLRAAGFDAIWIPPSYKNSSTGDVGYGPFDMYDLGDKFQKGGDTAKVKTRLGSKDELLRMIAVMHANGIEVIQDVVLNHNNGAGTVAGKGGQDPETAYSIRSSAGYKNFRFTSYATPFINDSTVDYFTRSGRWAKNYENFHPNAAENCTTGDICDAFFGPDISYVAGAIGQSSNIPTSGAVNVGGLTRAYYNPVQPNNYMRNSGRDWISWFKKQTGSDGWRWDAIKHFNIDVQEDYIYTTKYSLPVWAQGGQDMFCVGEWIGSTSDLDAYVNNVKTGVAPGGVTNEKHTGTFDFNLRGYGATGGIYSMVMGQGNYDMQSIPGEQQTERYMVYPDGHRTYRTVPFVNSHDSYRPRLDSVGNYLNALGVDSGWNVSNELGGNGKHIDPREPRLAAAYATISAVDGNPDFFFEDVFDLGTTGKRWSHLPSDTAQLKWRSDLINILQAHQKLGFKDGDYKVPTASTGTDAPFYQKGNSGDHLVIERAGKAIIGITDFYNTASDNAQDEEVYVTADASMIGQVLYDYSGAHGITTSTVFPDKRVLIKTAPVSHTIPNAHGHGYSIWAPAPTGVTITSVNDLYNYIASYTPQRSHTTVQEWEMADDLGDSHCGSLGQGGRLPDSSRHQRVAGKVYAAAFSILTYKVYPEADGHSLTASVWDLNGNKLCEAVGIAASSSPLTGICTAPVDGWYIVKVRNTYDTSAGQKCYVNVEYEAPAVVLTHDSSTLAATHAAVWTGNKGTSDVFDCGNWEEGKIPDSKTDVIIPNYATPFPVVISDFGVKGVHIDFGAALTVINATLRVAGSIVNNGTFTVTTATVEMNGTSSQTIPANAFYNNTVKSVTINNTAGVSLGGTVAITDVLTPTAGTLNAAGYLILKSDSLHTARVEKGSTAGGYVIGDVTVERFIPARFAWRMLTAPVTGTQIIRAAWQEGATSATDNPAPGYGTHITGLPIGNGFDQSNANSPSLLTWDVSMNMWMPATSTFSSIGSEQGYLILVKGDRSVDVNVMGTTTNTILRAKGNLKTGDQPFISVAPNAFMLIGNPYASPIDFTRTIRNNVPDRFYVYDPKRSATGAFVLLEGPDYKPMNVDGYYLDSSTLIQSGQAFMMEGNGVSAGTLQVTENCKTINERNVFRTMNVNDEKLKINLHFYNPNSSTTLADGAMERFDDTYASGVDADDAGKPDNMDENLAIERNSKLLMVERRPTLLTSDTIFLMQYNMQNKNYRLEIVPSNFITTTDTAYLEDNWLSTTTSVSLSSPTLYNFSVTQGSGSADPHRFRIIMRKATLAVGFTAIKAYTKNEGIMVEWNLATESDMHHYEVEKSANGGQFRKAATVPARWNNYEAASYSWLDASPLRGNNYYRIKAVEISGAAKYSNIVKVKTGGRDEIVVYPNPLKGNVLTVQFNNKQAGVYSLFLLNSAGQKVFAAMIEHSGGSSTQTLLLKKNLAKGIYQLQVSNGSDKQNMKVIIQ